MGAWLTYALDESEALVHVDDVQKGLNCGCRCPYCKAPLYAKNQGLTRTHHFAHAKGHNCEAAFESALHLLAKQILMETGKIMLPESYSGEFPTGLVSIRNIETEKWDDRYGIRPDAEGILANGERLLIEFYVSHKVDGKKRDIIVQNNLRCIEIDINYQALDKAELKEFLTCSTEDRHWVVEQKKTETKPGDGLSYGRNKWYDKVRDYLKEQFDNGNLILYADSGKKYALKDIGYDTCEVNTKFRRFPSDLLLSRSQKEDKGFISLNIRGRRRSEGFKHPKNLRILDIVVKSNGGNLKEEFGECDIATTFAHTIQYTNFKFR